MGSKRKIQFEPPKLCDLACCISTNAFLAASISSWFNKKNEYFCVIDTPRIKRVDVINEIIRRNNIVAALRPQVVITAGLTSEENLAIREKILKDLIVEINSQEEADLVLKGLFPNKEFNGVLKCAPLEIPYGLVLAKELNYKLIVETGAPSIITEYHKKTIRSKHLIVLDDIDDVAPVIAANYCFSINAEIAVIEKATGDVVSSFYKGVYNRAVCNDNKLHEDYSEVDRTIQQKRILVDYNAKLLLTFITSGFPYGYVFPDTVCTHLLSYPDFGLNLFWNIFYELKIGCTRNAMIINPGFFGDVEVPHILKSLKDSNIQVKIVENDNATLHHVHYSIESYPYDLLYICSHAGKIIGDQYKVRVLDTEGNGHHFVFNYVYELRVPPGEVRDDTKIEVMSYYEPVEFDGKKWNTSNVDNYNWSFSNGSVDSFFKWFVETSISDWDVIDKTKAFDTNHCYGIQVKDGNYTFGLHLIADHEHPVIINNSCESFYKVCTLCLFAGARSYVGSLAPVENSLAERVGKRVLSKEELGKPLPFVIWKAQKDLIDDPVRRCYVHFGCHFTRIKSIGIDTKLYLVRRIIRAIKEWSEFLNNPSAEKGTIENVKNILSFLKREVHKLVHNNKR